MRSKTSLIGMLMVLNLAHLLAQNDSIKIEFTQEKTTKESRWNETLCEILTKREKAGKDLWKFNLLGIFINDLNYRMGGKGLSFSYEKKFAPSWSYNIASITGTGNLHGFTISALFYQSLSGELRYYHNLNKRLRKGKEGVFSGNYWGLSFNNSYNKYRQVSAQIFDTLVSIRRTPVDTVYQFRPKEYSTYRFSHSLNVIYGIQRKIGQIGYFDCSLGIGVLFGYGTSVNGTNTVRINSPPKETIEWFRGYSFNMNIKVGLGVCF